MRSQFGLRLLAMLLLALPACSSYGEAQPAATPVWSCRVLARFPHDPSAFTQGLAWAEGELYEGTGLRGSSSLRRVDPASGRVLNGVALEPEYFGEGIAVMGDTLLQLTWTSGLCFVHDRRSLERIGRFRYGGQGWGLCYDADAHRLIMSDGSDLLRFLDPESFAETGRLAVRENGKPVVRLNELEYAGGRIYANVWPGRRIAVIDPADGRLAAWIDCSGLAAGTGRADALNGIAYDATAQRFLLTGKRWGFLYAVEFVEPSTED